MASIDENEEVLIHIGLDNYDSFNGGCTTHLATYILFLLFKELYKDVELIECPNLVRLNPAIPWKTRGNGAVAIRIRSRIKVLNKILRIVEESTQRYEETFSSDNGGLIIVLGDLPKELSLFYQKAVSDVVTIDFLEKILSRFLRNRVIYVNSYRRRGIIGALAAISWSTTRRSISYELIVYRSRKRYGYKNRLVDRESVVQFDKSYSNETFLNIDEEGKILITPHGPDPVLYGIRGLNPDVLLNALKEIRVLEGITGWCLFLSNQGTNDHVNYGYQFIKDAKPYRCVRIQGVLVEEPKIVRGGTIIVKICDSTSCIDAVVHKKSGLTSKIQMFTRGDYIELWGVVKYWGSINKPVVNVEGLIPIFITTKIDSRFVCPRCGNRLIKIGRGKGFRCVGCGYRTSIITYERISGNIRIVSKSLILPSKSAFKPLMKPLTMYLRPCKDIKKIRRCFEVIEPLEFL